MEYVWVGLGGLVGTNARYGMTKLMVGFLGAFTTFSSYTFEAIALAESGRWHQAMIHVVGSNGLGLVFCPAGMYLARHVAA